MTKPPALNPGDCIGVMAPSSYVEAADIDQSKALLEARGYKVFIHPQTYEQHKQSAGTHDQKIAALHELWARDDIKAIWAAGGGNRALRLLDMIDYEALKNHPKLLIGFSDTTALLNGIYAHTNIPTIHGPVFKNLHRLDDVYMTQCLELISGQASHISLDGSQVLKGGGADGTLVGGCLSIFQYLVGTPDCPDLQGAILFLEDTGDHISRIDRMFLHLKRQGVFAHISALVLGEFTDMQDGTRPFGFSLENIIQEYTAEHDIPVVINAPFGHGKNFLSLPIGINTSLNTEHMTLTFNDALVNH